MLHVVDRAVGDQIGDFAASPSYSSVTATALVEHLQSSLVYPLQQLLLIFLLASPAAWSRAMMQ